MGTSSPTEAPLSASGPLLDAVFEALPSPAAVLDARGRIVAVNGAWRRAGSEHGAVLGAPGIGSDYLEACDRAAARGQSDAAEAGVALRRVLEDGAASTTSVHVGCTADRMRWFRVRFTRLESGESRGALVLHDEITGGPLARDDLHRELDLLEMVHDAVIVTDDRGAIRSWNRAAETLYGYEEDEVLGRPIDAVLPCDDAPTLRERLREIRDRNGRLELRLATRDKRGAPVLVDLRLAAIRAAGGDLLGIVGCSSDVTRRSAAERELEARNRELEAIFRAQPDLMFRLDAETRVIEFRAGRASDLYLPPEQFLGRRMPDVLPPELSSALLVWLEQLRREGGVITNEYDLAVAGGVNRFEARLVPFHDGGSLMWVRDVTSGHTAQLKQRRLMDELDHRVKNALAAIVGIADETLSRASSLAGFADAFRGRLQTMARAHEVLARSRWEGADLSALVETTLGAYLEAYRGRVATGGDGFRVPGRWVTPLALVLHELTMNALRHGALARAGGTLSLSWRVTREGGLALVWDEAGELAGPLGPRGTGLALIEDFVTLELDGRLELRLEGGLECRIVLPAPSPPRRVLGPRAAGEE